MSSNLEALDPSARTIKAGDLCATWLPGLGMLGAVLEHRGVEILGRVEDVAGFAKIGRVCGIALLYPWANRLGGFRYHAAGQEVTLDASSPLLYFDDRGLPMHGVPWSRLDWQLTAQDSNSLTARLDWASEKLLAVFPYPHQIEMSVVLEPTRLTIETAVQAGASRPVPVSFGFHPYLDLPGANRSEWRVHFPAMQHLELDARQIPTGNERPFPGLDGALNGYEFDDGFALAGEQAQFSVQGGGRRVTFEFQTGFPYAQIFVPPDKDYIALEPMTAPANALVSGHGLRLVEPGNTFRARFCINVEPT